jgi:ABC-2 type transport system ATP-binding protein
MAAPAIQLAGIRKSYGRTTVLDGVDLVVQPGEVFALLGPNGAGKTTLIRIMATLTAADSGTAVIAGHDVLSDPEAVRRSISVTGQNAAVDEVLTGTENLRMMGRLSGLTREQSRERAVELIRTFDLVSAAERRVGKYSGGMRRRLDLALGLVTTPPIIFLDEPTTGLDTRSRQELWTIIERLSAEGRTIFLTTQYLEEADQLADRIAVVDGGSIVAEGTPSDLKSLLGGEVVELHDAREELVREIPTDGSIAGLRAAIDELDRLDVPDGRVGIRRPTLDEVFLSLTADLRTAGTQTTKKASAS